MKIHTIAKILTVVLMLFWFVPLQGKKLAPEFFGIAAVQWTSAIVVAILTPVVVLMALSMIFKGVQSRTGLGVLVLAGLILVSNLTFCGIGGTILARAQLNLLSLHQRDAEMIRILTERVVSGESAEGRAKWAGILYSTFGVRAIWKDADDHLAQYVPSVEDQERSQRTVGSSMLVKQTNEMIASQLKQMPWLFGLNIGSFSIIMLAGLAWLVYRPKVLPEV